MMIKTVRNRPNGLASSGGETAWQDIKASAAAGMSGRDVNFMDVVLEVAPGVVAPRIETELLVNELLGRLAADSGIRRVVDMCCGCGAIALALANRHPGIEVWACDLLEAAVDVTQRNVRRHGLERRVRVARGDLFSALEGELLAGKVDLVVANPPYISTGKLGSEKAHLLEDEPREAFDGGPYGLTVHQRLIQDAPTYLVPGGWLFFEFGHGQERQVSMLIRRRQGYEEVLFVRDAQGAARVAGARWRG